MPSGSCINLQSIHYFPLSPLIFFLQRTLGNIAWLQIFSSYVCEHVIMRLFWRGHYSVTGSDSSGSDLTCTYTDGQTGKTLVQGKTHTSCESNWLMWNCHRCAKGIGTPRLCQGEMSGSQSALQPQRGLLSSPVCFLSLKSPTITTISTAWHCIKKWHAANISWIFAYYVCSYTIKQVTHVRLVPLMCIHAWPLQKLLGQKQVTL